MSKKPVIILRPTVDMQKLKAQNQHVVAVGNKHVNARGDIIGDGGKVVKTKEALVKEQYAIKTPMVNITQPILNMPTVNSNSMLDKSVKSVADQDLQKLDMEFNQFNETIPASTVIPPVVIKDTPAINNTIATPPAPDVIKFTPGQPVIDDTMAPNITTHLTNGLLTQPTLAPKSDFVVNNGTVTVAPVHTDQITLPPNMKPLFIGKLDKIETFDDLPTGAFGNLMPKVATITQEEMQSPKKSQGIRRF